MLGPGRVPLKRRVLYQLLTDRFAADGGREIRGLTRTGPASRWLRHAGGTYDGIVHRLDYLKDLGVSAIWISPIPENSFIPKDGSRPRSDGYHGYWARDFERLNTAFGNEQALKSLLGADRGVSRSEIRKLCLYAVDRGSIELDDVRAVVGDASGSALRPTRLVKWHSARRVSLQSRGASHTGAKRLSYHTRCGWDWHRRSRVLLCCSCRGCVVAALCFRGFVVMSTHPAT